MNRFLRRGAVTGALLLSTLGTAAATPPHAIAESNDITTGAFRSFTQADTTFKIEVSAHGTPQNATGTIRVDSGFPPYTNLVGDVECLNVNGNTTMLLAKLTKTSDPALTHLFFTAVDNGPSGNGVPDLWNVQILNKEQAENIFGSPLTCLFPFSVASIPVQSGNIAVKDNTL